ncbi:hypothetical protein Scep_026017 [Stephania cephalantha]|uniref:CCHC-type domain-containing protein n=1 Tax=Stephania cephalantha TaxID=152367 RepID=A0AAP0EPY1_9MAGN
MAQFTHTTPNPKESDRERQYRVFMDFLEIQPLTYNGGLDVEESENWVFEMEKTFNVIPYDEPTKVKLAAFMLKSDAYLWWIDTKEREGEVDTCTWERFKELFLEKYFPMADRDRKREEFLHLQQGDMTVREYAFRFERLIRYAREYVPSEREKNNRFVHGLRPSIQAIMLCGRGEEYGQTVNAAEMTEKLVKRLPNPKESDWRTQSRAFKEFLQLQPLTFNGGVDSEEAANWVYGMERTFGVIPHDEPTKVKLAAFLLKGNAHLWWVDTKEREGEVGTWECFKELFLKKYFPKTERYRKCYELKYLKQGDMSVMEYAAKFEKLCRYVQDFRVKKEVGEGLRPSFVAAFMNGISEFQEVFDKAETVEFAEECMLADNNKQKGSDPISAGHGCYNCGEIGHKIRNCPYFRK